MPSDDVHGAEPGTEHELGDDVMVRITYEKVFSGEKPGKKAQDWAGHNALPDAHVEFIHVHSGEQINEWEPRDE